LASVIKDGVSGTLVQRSESADDIADRLSDAFVTVHDAIVAGQITPQGVANEICDFKPEVQLAKCYENHRHLQNARFSDLQLAKTGTDN